MELGFIGLGRMGKNMVQRLLTRGHKVVAYNRSPQPLEEVISYGAEGAPTLHELAKKLSPPRIVWIMVSPGGPVDEIIFGKEGIFQYLSEGDIVIDGGNSHYKDSQRRAKKLKEKKIYFLDGGSSGGPEGAKKGLSLTIGGDKIAFEKGIPIFEALSAEEGFAYVGPSGAGHFAKMVHNAIEYGVLEALGEGFSLLEKSPFKNLDLVTIARTWNHGGVIRSFLLELAERAFEKDPKLENISGYVEDTGEGRWAVEEALKREVPFWAASSALFSRYRSREEESFVNKVVAALRREFGGHQIRYKSKQ